MHATSKPRQSSRGLQEHEADLVPNRCAEVHRTMPARLSTSNLRCQTVSLLLPDMHDRQLLCLSALLCFPFSATMTAVPVAVDCSAPLPRAWGQDWRVNKLELGKACT